MQRLWELEWLVGAGRGRGHVAGGLFWEEAGSATDRCLEMGRSSFLTPGG